MLLSLSVNNFTLVEHLDVDFSAGMTVITGETGAGKSLVLDALGMALGDRTDTDRIRHNAERLDISACFDIGEIPRAQGWLQEQDFGQDNHECILRRTITREGRSRGYINGGAATMQQLRTLGEMLLDIHSQLEHQSLLRKATHRQLLDNFAEAATPLETVQTRFRDWRAASSKLTALTSRSDELAARQELLTFQVEELDQLGPGEQELPELEAEHRLLANAEGVLQDSHAILALCRGESEGEAGFNLQQGINQVLHLLSDMSGKPRALEDAEKIFRSIGIDLDEASREVQHHIDSFEADPERLQFLDDRLGAVHQLARKHRVPAADLYTRHQELKAELESLTGGSDNIETLAAEVETLAESYREAARKLSQLRQQAATAFASAVNGQLQQLSMKGAALSVALTDNPDGQFTAHGLESVEFLISANPGQPPGALGKIASGGELSRVSLAIQVIAARHSAIPTLLFDEVDVGIGGATAGVVGRLLKQLGDQGQVICITHQPQVASCGHQHFLAEKQTTADGAESSLTQLDDSQRMDEIARMLGGAKITEKTREHAREMISLAVAE